MSDKLKSFGFLGIVILLAAVSGWLYTTREIKYGLDVRGGVRITYEIDTEDLKPEQRERMGEIRANLTRILTNRVGTALGVVEGNVQPKGERQFVVELPGAVDVEEARRTLGSTASIKLYHAKTVRTELAPFREYVIGEEIQRGGKPVVTFRRANDPNSEPILPGTPEYAKVIESWGEPILEGEMLRRAYPQFQGNFVVPILEFSTEGANRLRAWSQQFQNTREYLAAVLDGEVLSIAYLQDNTILSDNARIDGRFTADYVKTLTDLLNSGSLPVQLKELSSQTVSPTIGMQAKDLMVQAGIYSFVFICLFLLVYYQFPGLVATVALGLYILFTIVALMLVNATFSLAAIAGFILSISMAVDANILIFERVKEELRLGKPLMRAVEVGFNRTFSAIFDSNACSIITCLVLYNLGTGPVKGFAFTLGLGIALSLFTAISVTRSLLVFLVGIFPKISPNLFGTRMNWFGENFESRALTNPIRVIENRNRYFAISALLILPGLIAVALGGLKPNVEFQGGFEGQYKMTGQKVYTVEQILGNLERNGIRGANVKIAEDGADRFAYVTVPPLAGLGIGDRETERRIAEAAGFSLEDEVSFSAVGPTVQRETVRNAILGVVLSALFIVIYLSIRFGIAVGGVKNGLRFATAAILTLMHDVLFIVGAAAILGLVLRWEISSLFITAMLTVIGFSVHDTIVIFDRIRENLRRASKGEDFQFLVNKSVSQSFARSINTSATTVVALAILIAVGTATPDLKFFCATMLLGILIGTYSSIFNAAPILYLMDRAVERKKGPDATLVAEALRERQRARAQAIALEAGTGAAPEWESGAYGTIRRRQRIEPKRTQVLDDDEER